MLVGGGRNVCTERTKRGNLESRGLLENLAVGLPSNFRCKDCGSCRSKLAAGAASSIYFLATLQLLLLLPSFTSSTFATTSIASSVRASERLQIQELDGISQLTQFDNRKYG